MNKYIILEKKLEKLCDEIDLAISNVNEDTKRYLRKYKLNIKNNIEKVHEKRIEPSGGELMGTLRAISEFDNLSAIDSLYDAAYDVDIYYREECKTF